MVWMWLWRTGNVWWAQEGALESQQDGVMLLGGDSWAGPVTPQAVRAAHVRHGFEGFLLPGRIASFLVLGGSGKMGEWKRLPPEQGDAVTLQGGSMEMFLEHICLPELRRISHLLLAQCSQEGNTKAATAGQNNHPPWAAGSGAEPTAVKPLY